MDFRKRPYLLAGILLITLSVFLRSQFLEFKNGDLLLIREWYDFLHQNGYKGLANGEFSNYPPAYLYLLYFATLLSKWIAPFTALKLIPTAFDLISTFTVYKIARLKHRDDKPYLFAALFFLLPTVMLNSTGWGQIESTYASFLLMCIYLILTDRPFLALIAFGAAFSFKAQAIFLLPFLGIMFLRGRVRWYNFFSVPAAYLLLALPAILLGRSWESVLFLYAGQVGQFEELARYAPNLYLLLLTAPYHPTFEIGLGIFAIIMLAWAWVNWRAKPPVTQTQIILTALASAAWTPFLLPKMHDRYFYPADVISFAAAVLIPKLWFIPVLFQISSGVAYSIFLFGAPPIAALIGAAVNTVLVIVIARRQIRELRVRYE
ncbi:MAG: hypothetical protein DPW18_18905 [Chloroflexi bacterium]|nr:hypothetical protein [Chloroflexota bacterium]MDL1940747.1 hypothetical protein [Chloroflexi bacterium CFX2]